MKVSPNFTLSELTTTTRSDLSDADGDGDRRERFPNAPDANEIRALGRLCRWVLEPVRHLLGDRPYKITSGYRCDALNAIIGGSATSQHKYGEAADGYIIGSDAEADFERIAERVRAGAVLDGIVCDQAIIYPSGFFHLSYTQRRKNRGEVLRSLAPSGSGGPYVPYDGPRKN